MICMIGVLITTRLSLLLGTLWVRDKKFICVYTYMHIYTSVFLHLFVCGPLKNYKFILIPQIPISPTGFISPISLFATSFSNSEKTGSFYLQYYIYCSILVHIQSSFKTANPYPCEKHIWQTRLQHLHTAPLSLILQYLVKVIISQGHLG